MRQTTCKWGKSGINIVFQDKPDQVVTTLTLLPDDMEARHELELKAKAFVCLWNNMGDEGITVKTSRLHKEDILEVCMQYNLPIPSPDQVDDIVHYYTKGIEVLLGEWESVLINAIEAV